MISLLYNYALNKMAEKIIISGLTAGYNFIISESANKIYVIITDPLWSSEMQKHYLGVSIMPDVIEDKSDNVVNF